MNDKESDEFSDYVFISNKNKTKSVTFKTINGSFVRQYDKLPQLPEPEQCKCCSSSIDAVKNKHFSCLKSLFDGNDKKICDYAAINGYLECLKYAHENGCEWTQQTCKYAYETGSYNCVKYMLDNGCNVNYIGIVTECYMYMYFL
jgi:hypothetical protein